jgi:hypothetical protein
VLPVDLSSAREVRRNGVIVELIVDKSSARAAVTTGPTREKLNTFHG